MSALVGVSFGGSFAWGASAASSLLIGALIALWFRISMRWIGLIMAFGSGVLISEGASDDTVAFVQTFAAGAILTMLATTMMPEAFEHGGNRVGIATTLGFATAYAVHVYACRRSAKSCRLEDGPLAAYKKRASGSFPIERTSRRHRPTLAAQASRDAARGPVSEDSR